MKDLLDCVRATDKEFRVFGSESHRYLLGPVLSESEVIAFEGANRVQLPEEYRQFLTEVGNGGAGPYYGLAPLSAFGRDLSKPFPIEKATEELSVEEQQCLPDDRDEYPGILEFCHEGCGAFAYLVVNGPTYGTIWDGREEFYPTGLMFSAWYRGWLDRSLRSLENGKLVLRLRVGMSLTEVLAEVGGNWRELPACNRMMSDDIPAILEFCDEKLITKIVPWPYL